MSVRTAVLYTYVALQSRLGACSFKVHIGGTRPSVLMDSVRALAHAYMREQACAHLFRHGPRRVPPARSVVVGGGDVVHAT